MTTTQSFTAADLRTAVAAAVRAPSLHNSQPWRFRLRDGAMEILADHGRRPALADPSGWALRVACGAALLNARLALAVHGIPVEARLCPDPSEPDLLARLVPQPSRPPTPAELDGRSHIVLLGDIDPQPAHEPAHEPRLVHLRMSPGDVIEIGGRPLVSSPAGNVIALGAAADSAEVLAG